MFPSSFIVTHSQLESSPFPNDVASSQQLADVFPALHNSSPVFPETPSFFCLHSIFVEPVCLLSSCRLPRVNLCLLKAACITSLAERVMSRAWICPHFDHLFEVSSQRSWQYSRCFFPPESKFPLLSDFISPSLENIFFTDSSLLWYCDLAISSLEADLSWVNCTADIMGSLCVYLIIQASDYWKAHTFIPDCMCSYSPVSCLKITL